MLSEILIQNINDVILNPKKYPQLLLNDYGIKQSSISQIRAGKRSIENLRLDTINKILDLYNKHSIPSNKHYRHQYKDEKVLLDGKQISLRELASLYDIHYYTILKRYKDGVRGKKLIEQPKIFTATINGQLLSFSEISRKYGIKRKTITCRYKNGKRGMDLVKQPKSTITTTINGKRLSFAEISRKYGIKRKTVAYRYNTGKRGMDLIAPV